jgi:ArsR family transcriptional regulator
MELNAAVDTMAALSTPSRVEVLRLLAKEGKTGLPSGEIAVRLKAAQNTLSTQLMLLSKAGLVVSQRNKRQIIYRVNFETIRELMQFLADDCAAGEIRSLGKRTGQ